MNAPARAAHADDRRTARSWIAAVLIFAGSLCAFAYLARRHQICTYVDADFYGRYAPDAERIAGGLFPRDRFTGPGFAVALAVVRPLAGDLFAAGKAIAVFSAALAGLLAFLLFRESWGDTVGLGAQLLLIANPVFARLAIEPVTDMPFLMLCMAAQTVFLASRLRPAWRVGGGAALAALAFLIRFNAVFLPVAFALAIALVNLFEVSWRKRLLLLGGLTAVSLGIAAPWLYANYRHRGSPFYNENYLNIATEFYPEISGQDTSREGVEAVAARFHSFSDVLRHDPVRILTHYPSNLVSSFVKSLGSWPMGLLTMLGLIFAWRSGLSKRAIALLLPVGLLLLLMALNHFEPRYYLFATVLYGALAALAAKASVEWLASRTPLRPPAVAAATTGALVLAALFEGSRAAERLRVMYAEEPREIFAACAYFREHGLRHSPVLAYKPHVAYVCGQDPAYLPRFDSEAAMEQWMLESAGRFVAVGPEEIKRRPQVASWRDPAALPRWLRLVWSSERLSLYEIVRPTPGPKTP